MYTNLDIYNLYLKNRCICTDTRNIKTNSIFFALKGENFDANKFAIKAIEMGCAYAVIDDKNILDNCLVEDIKNKLIYVQSTLICLQNIAKIHRNKLHIPIIGITGTNGKTTTKELIKSVLSIKHKTFATYGNLNNHIGVPLSLLSISDDIEIAIIEMGANHINEIAELCEISQPNIGIVTNVGKAHLEGFGSFKNVIETKIELYKSVEQQDGIIFVNAANDILKEKSQNNSKIVYYTTNNADINNISNATYTKTSLIESNSNYLNLCLKFVEPNSTEEVNNKDKNYNTANINTNLTGNYNLENIAATAAIGKYFDLNINEIKRGLENYTPNNLRSQIIEGRKNTIIADTYNANPDSMLSAINNFISLKTPLKKTFILGDMKELGKFSASAHAEIVSLLEKYGDYEVFLVGENFYNTPKPESFSCFKSVKEFIELFHKQTVSDRFILIKGSNSIGLDRLIEIL